MQPEAGVLLCRLNVQVQMSTDSLLSEQEFLLKVLSPIAEPKYLPPAVEAWILVPSQLLLLTSA